MGKLLSMFSSLKGWGSVLVVSSAGSIKSWWKTVVQEKKASGEGKGTSGEEIGKLFLFCELNIGTDLYKHEFYVEKITVID